MIDLRKYVLHILCKIGTSKLYEDFISLHCPCKKWDLYICCDDPDILEENRLTKIPNNCSTYLCGACHYNYFHRLYNYVYDYNRSDNDFDISK